MVADKHNVRVLLLVTLISITGILKANEGGFKQYLVNKSGVTIKLFAYRPPTCKKTDILVVFHGLKRKAKQLRNKAVNIANQACLEVFAPKFDKHNYPNWRYHRAGVYRSGRVQSETQWSDQILNAVLQRIKEIAGSDESRMFLFGHSAGGQFLSRVTAYFPPENIERFIIANPSVYVLPSLHEKVPYGFSGIFSKNQASRKLKEYLALPITIYLGQRDIGEKYLVKSKRSMQQGSNRLERGRYIFSYAKQLAQDRGWTFNWQLVEVPSVAHSSKGMLNAKELLLALGFTESHCCPTDIVR
jgi:hypothetical protein